MNDNFNDLGFIINGLRHLTGRQAYECCLQGAIIVDVRDEIETAIKAFGEVNVLFCLLIVLKNYSVHSLLTSRL